MLLSLSLPLLAFSASASALQPHWKRDGDPNNMCLWKHPRVAVIRDTLYVDGGWLYTRNTTQSYPTTSNIPSGQVYSINFTRPFSVATDSSSIFTVRSSTNGPSNNIFPNYYDGFMFTNNNEYILYGGLVRSTSAYALPDADDVLAFEQYQYGPVRQQWAPGPILGKLPSGVTRYITAGAGVSVPSENLGFYFSGLHGTDWRNITAPTSRSPYNATVVANTLISVDMSVMRQEKWSNDTIPDSVTGRVSGEAVWIPTSNKGVVVIIGGVSDAESAWNNGLNSTQASSSKSKSPGYMQTVTIYDIDSKKWYTQNTTGDVPSQLAEACSVVATAKDSSSHNVYLYGGYDALSDESQPSDDVYILSIPSFVWVKAVTGTASHGRHSHRCAKPYPDQMLVVGGDAPTKNNPLCLEGGAVQIFNLNSLQWQKSYDPSKWSEYKVPSIVTAKIGGSADGGASTTAPSTWANSDLQGLFGTKYSKTVTNYYPYQSIAAAPSSTSTSSPSSSSSGLPKWAAILIGVLVGLIGICTILGIALLWLRHQHKKRGTSSEAGGSTTENGMMSWLRGIPPQHAGGKAGTAATETESEDVTSTAGMTSPGGDDMLGSPTGKVIEPIEAGGAAVHEMPDTSGPTELATPPLAEKEPDVFVTPPPPPGISDITRPDSPTTGGGGGALQRLGSIDERSSQQQHQFGASRHSHTHSRSISSDFGPGQHSPINPSADERGPSPVSPPESARTSIASTLGHKPSAASTLGHKPSAASTSERRRRGESSFSEIME